MTFELEVMKTKNTAFSVEILGNQCAPMQYVRELTQNSIEAIKEKGERGQILWTFDRQIENLTGTRKLCIMDNGAGMDGEDIRNLMNRMFSSGKQQGLTENYGIGAKVAGLHRSPLGMI
jgi:DNA topoisomerase VI subunit B